MQPSMKNKALLTITDLAAYLSVSRPTMHAIIASDGFPEPVVLARRRLWALTDVKRWKAKQEKRRVREPA